MASRENNRARLIGMVSGQEKQITKEQAKVYGIYLRYQVLNSLGIDIDTDEGRTTWHKLTFANTDHYQGVELIEKVIANANNLGVDYDYIVDEQTAADYYRTRYGQEPPVGMYEIYLGIKD